MRHLAIWAATVAAAVIVGCGPGKELPDEVPKATPKSEPLDDPLGHAPAMSDPAAKAAADRAVKAITQGDLTRLAKAKISISSYRGSIHLLNSTTPTSATLRWDVIWPDRALVKYEFNLGSSPSIVFRFLRPLGWMSTGPNLGNGNPSEIGKMFDADLFAKHGLILGLTLADPRAVFFDLSKSASAPPTTSVKISLPELPIMGVTFDDQSGLPIRVEYHPLESRLRVKKVRTMSGHKPEQGFVLPTELELQQNGLPAEKWTLEKWEFPDKIDETKFDLPK